MEVSFIATNKLKPMITGGEKISNVYLRRHIKEHGILQPLYVTKELVVYNGNRRLKVAKQLGIKELPCYIHNITEEQIREFRALSSWEFVPTKPGEYKKQLKRLCQQNK